MRGAKPYLQSVWLDPKFVPSWDEYPFNVPAVRNLKTLEFHEDVTFLVGENGSGKSTLIEAIASRWGFNPEGGNRNTQFSTGETHSVLHRAMRYSKSHIYPGDGYFLRAESFYNLATYMDEIGDLRGYGGTSLHEQSHGEAFMATLLNKLKGGGLYIFDEPEAALSPQRQLSALARIHQLVRDASQLIIATHSPILLAYPRAKIYLLDEEGYHEVQYEDTEHYRVTRDFLNRYERMLQILLD